MNKTYKLTACLLLSILIGFYSNGQAGYKLYILKNENSLPSTIRVKLYEEFNKLTLKDNPNIIFPKVAEDIFRPVKGKVYTFFIINPGKEITQHIVSHDGIRKNEQLLRLGVRGSSMEFWNFSEFETFFRDTLIVLDTLNLDFSKLAELSNDEILILINQYRFSEFTNDTPLMICAECLKTPTGQYYNVSLSSESIPNKRFDAIIYFFGKNDKEVLFDFANSLRDQRNLILDETEYLQTIQAFIRLQWGKCETFNIRNWLISNEIY